LSGHEGILLCADTMIFVPQVDGGRRFLVEWFVKETVGREKETDFEQFACVWLTRGGRQM
jgi:hypothetical protein